MPGGRVILFIFISILFTYSCTKLNETLEGNLTPGQVAKDTSADALLRGLYASLEYTFTSYQEIFALSDFTTDEAIAPTRGGDWDDNGSWRVFHQHKWDANNSHIRDCFNSLGNIVYTATDMLQYKPNVQQQAEARLLRAWAMYLLLDLFNQVPYRDPGESLIQPARVRRGIEALDYIISEINSTEADLPAGPVYKANKFAAKVLLMKCYLNKAVYANRSDPVFDPTDMNKVISLADDVINSGQFSFSANYFDNFAPDNGTIGRENIFTQLSSSNDNYALSLAWLTVLHYNQGGGFNGFTTLSDFYNKFEPNDKRREAVYDYPNSPPNPGHRVNLGFLISQQYDLYTDAPLRDRTGAPLIFTSEVKNIETSANIECTGIRPMKYAPDYLNFSQYSHPGNDFVYFRLPDVLLMKAEAILRAGTPTSAGIYGSTALSIVNAIRTDTSRGATAMSSVNLDSLLDERGRELWWENWRRQDLIRFKKFLMPFQEKGYQSDPKYLLFPIPNDQLAVNQDNLYQNTGY
jgi:starch-binding outer membrane protein, SusD/RagB family